MSLVQSHSSWELFSAACTPLCSTGVLGSLASPIPDARLCFSSPRLWTQALSCPWMLS